MKLYRCLEEGEIIKEGDFYFDDDCDEVFRPDCIGLPFDSGAHFQYLRPVTVPSFDEMKSSLKCRTGDFCSNDGSCDKCYYDKLLSLMEVSCSGE